MIKKSACCPQWRVRVLVRVRSVQFFTDRFYGVPSPPKFELTIQHSIMQCYTCPRALQHSQTLCVVLDTTTICNKLQYNVLNRNTTCSHTSYNMWQLTLQHVADEYFSWLTFQPCIITKRTPRLCLRYNMPRARSMNFTRFFQTRLYAACNDRVTT